MKLKDVYDSVKQGKEIKKLKERGEYIEDSGIIQLHEEPNTSELELLTENKITQWISNFFDKVMNRQSQEMIRDIYFKDPALGKELEKIRTTMNNINAILAKKIKVDPKYVDKMMRY